MDLSKTLIVLTNQPLTKHNFIRFGVGSTYKNWKIKYWSILPLINKKIYKDYTKKGSRYKKNKNFKVIFSYSNLIAELKKLPKNFFYLNNGGNFILASLIERFLFIKGGRKIIFKVSPEIELNLFTTQSIKNYILKNNILVILKRIIFMLKDKLSLFISKKISNINSELVFVFNNYMVKKIKTDYNKKLIKINSPEYELFLKTKNKKKIKTKRKSIVFIDDVIEDNFDYKLTYAQDSNRKKVDYWTSMEQLFNYLKKNFVNFDIKIAAHHRRNKYDLPLKKYKFFFDQTPELIKNSDIVLSHNSFACQLAVLYNKPLIFLISDYYKKHHYNAYLLTQELSKTLGSPIINVEKYSLKPNAKDVIKSVKINQKKYGEYKKKYIHHQKNKNYGSWSTILKYIEKKSKSN